MQQTLSTFSTPSSVSRPNSAAVMNADIDIANILELVNNDIGKGDIDPALHQTFILS